MLQNPRCGNNAATEANEILEELRQGKQSLSIFKIDIFALAPKRPL